MPCSLAAAITSASRTLPPGWMTARTPAAASTSRPSRNGKNASDAATVSAVASSGLAGAHDREARRVDAAHLPGADADHLVCGW